MDIVLSHYILDGMVRILPRLSRIQMIPAEIRDLADSFMFLADVIEPQGDSTQTCAILAISLCY